MVAVGSVCCPPLLAPPLQPPPDPDDPGEFWILGQSAVTPSCLKNKPIRVFW